MSINSKVRSMPVSSFMRYQAGSVVSLAVAAIVGSVVVLGLFLLMKTLITKDFKEPDERKVVPLPSIVQQKEEVKAERKKRKIQEIDDVDTPPPPTIEQDLDVDVNLDSVNINVDTRAKGLGGIGLETSFSDGDLVPLVAIQPNYPRRAQERGTEGYVIVEFTVNTEGATQDIIVVENAAKVSGEYVIGRGKVFEREAVRAAQRLRYKPRVIDGKPTIVTNYPYRFTFNLEQ